MSDQLRRIQKWMQTAIMHPDGVVAGAAATSEVSDAAIAAAVDAVIEPSQRLTAAQRLQIYGDAYFARLLECLREEFPAMCYAVGEDAFYGLALQYLTQYPSRSYTLAQLGARFPNFLAQTRPPRDSDAPDWADFMIETARLERTYSEVFDGAGLEGGVGLRPERLAALTTSDWEAARLRLAPCVRLLELQFPVHEYAAAVRRQSLEATTPGAGEEATGKASAAAEKSSETAPSGAGERGGVEKIPVPAPRATYLLVTRREYVVRRWELTATQFRLLEALQAGLPIAVAINRTAESLNDAQAARFADDLRAWFAEWGRLSVFADITL